jgi:endogenous inhibitor of DNA gyrase (YacG/DUF329 family)
MEGGVNVSIIGRMKHRCPVCRKVIDGAVQKQSREEKFYPFCSQRCKLIDLGRWLDGNYRIVSEPKGKDEEQIDQLRSDMGKAENTGQSGANDR